MYKTWLDFLKQLITINPKAFTKFKSEQHSDISGFVGYIQRKYHGQHKRINYRKGTRGRI